ncbi:DUF2573 family protein [Jeotgalibacillus proteolyticus]|uniref:DUF2573 domain-containing protein n=1 Tax=Jeotgalibacillus proteolyticus TaxID=2082395 RepID=A0A2S5GAT6_9BACL|nr:DUF2573 family protein [Jeotgalibacillus proteolyticus]PPA70122.1 DUF2573 domain-containing protein [Jeotgalibacillus proteolyticus]
MDTKELSNQLEAMVDKYAELLIGEKDEESVEKIRQWILYNHIAKATPALAKHWNSLYPEGKEEMKKVVLEIQKKNKELKAKEE